MVITRNYHKGELCGNKQELSQGRCGHYHKGEVWSLAGVITRGGVVISRSYHKGGVVIIIRGRCGH